MALYDSDSDASRIITKFITEFFNIRKGVRCRTRFNGRTVPFNYEDYGEHLDKHRFNLVSINEENVLPELAYGLSHFMQHIFNKEVLTEAEGEVDTLLKQYGIVRSDIQKRRPIVKKVMEGRYLGITNVIDIDSPYIGKDTTQRMDFFDSKVVGYFNEATKMMASEFDEVGELYNCQFSGNGFYFINESYYPDEYLGMNYSTLPAYVLKIKRICDEVDYRLKMKNIPIQIKFKKEGWSRFNKMPFAYHDSRARLCIPIGKEHIGNIDVKWLDKHTNIENLMGYREDEDYEGYWVSDYLVDEIIKSCRWEKIW